MNRTCAECGLEACHSKTCPYLIRLREIYGAARALVYAGTPLGREMGEARLKRAVERQIDAEMAAEATKK